MATLENIRAKILRLQTEAEAIVKKQSLAAIGKISELMEKHGLTLVELESHLGGRRGRKKAGIKVAGKPNRAAKYVDPKSGATWTGHGRAPAWIANAKNRDRFLIDAGAQRLTSAAERASKAGNYVRGPQMPKYRDPETGATWSGRGRAPAWLAEVKDRTAFLIDGKGQVAPTTAAPNKSMVKKTVVKKAATRKTTGEKTVVGAAASKKRAAKAKKATVKKVASKKAVSKVNAAKTEAASMDAPE
ncbi:H-NS histone family protein [Burkholderia anthina]|uniref:H-NS family nucleoid-associated regulatory protein n=1 Tax=Burkholderia anthina TaxID=179879 RepID=UPI00158E88E6|nr:H-NS family nucleoid-associated regulatory protein [Burkholderia anthina]MBY4865158.1 H-NS histone family protein [Burkholderia anthina]